MKNPNLFLAAALSFAALCASVQTANSQTTPRWLRQNAISPDGSTVAFVYQGDIFTVSASGGEAVQITSNPAHDTEPLWSPDGQYIVFASFREGSKDIWAVPAKGGTPWRLTDFGGRENPLTVSPDGKVYFGASIQEDPVSAVFPGDLKLYCIGLDEALEAAKAEWEKGVAVPDPRQSDDYKALQNAFDAYKVMQQARMSKDYEAVKPKFFETVYSMVDRGHSMRVPVDLNSTFLK